MRKNRGFISSLVIFTISLGALYYFYITGIRPPDEESGLIAKLIFKYPNVSRWEVKTNGDFCPFFDDKCKPPAKIFFESEDNWHGIYNYYKEYLTSGGWISHSLIVTSLPTSIVFTDGATCRIELSQASLGVFKKTKHNRYKMLINCANVEGRNSI